MIITYPAMDVLEKLASKTPDYMRPNTQPYTISAPGILTADECKAISEAGNKLDGYTFHGCHASTREFDRPLDELISPVINFTKFVNDTFFDFNLDEDPAAWLQTYSPGDNYQLHMDGAPGQTRKLTAVVMLSNESDFSGGTFEILNYPQRVTIPHSQGTVIIFGPWVLHEVNQITSGIRQSLNVGFFGPTFR